MSSRENGTWLGKVDITPHDPIIAGEFNTWEIVYTAGRYGIDNGGRIKLVWKHASDWGLPQWENPQGPNYVRVISSAKADFTLNYDPKGYYRPWLKALTINIDNGYLSEGDTVTIILGDQSCDGKGMRAQTFYQKDFYFRLLVDCFESNKFKEVPDQPFIPVVSGKAERLKVIAPSNALPFEKLKKIVIKSEDVWGNVVRDYSAHIKIRSMPKIEGLPEDINFTGSENGLVEIKDIMLLDEGIYTIEAVDVDGNIRALSNPIKCSTKLYADKRLYWGDLHAQNKSTLGMGTDQEFFEYAEQVGSVDAAAVQGNDFHLSAESWENLKKAVDAHYKPGSFVTFLGYEWSGNTSAGGDHNVYYVDPSIPIHRSSHWQVEDKKDEANDRYPVNELYDELLDKQAFIIPHIGGRRSILDFIRQDMGELLPVIEICSVHGRFEWFLHEAFAKDLIVGVVGNSDDHTCRPGAAHPTKPALNCRNGLTGIYCEKLTRESVWEAIKSRRCYATTGERIILEATANGQPMGSVFELKELPKIHVRVMGTGPIEKVEVIKDTEVVYSYPMYKESPVQKDKFRILWGGARITSRGRHTKWDGRLEIKGASFKAVQEVAFDNPNEGIKSWNASTVEWVSNTSGDVDGLMVECDAMSNASFEFISGPLRFEFSGEELVKGNILKECGGVNQHVKVERVHQKPGTDRVDFEFVDKDARAGLNRYYIRVTQENQEMAWSSPFYVFMT